MEKWLNNWIIAVRRRRSGQLRGRGDQGPEALGGGGGQVEEVEGNPGYYRSKFCLRPHYQLEGLTVSLRLVSKLPSVKAGG